LARRGRSHSRRPVSRRPPAWCKYGPEEVEALVVKLARDGLPSSRIGITLRDQYGIPLVKAITGKSMKQILESAGLKPTIPEDLNNLILKATNLSQHLTKNKADAANRRALELIVSKIRRVSDYYKNVGILPKNWEYRPEHLSLA
jgi:small subunit ribosomal protein S15